jgi:prephenate dehydrogenase
VFEIWERYMDFKVNMKQAKFMVTGKEFIGTTLRKHDEHMALVAVEEDIGVPHIVSYYCFETY